MDGPISLEEARRLVAGPYGREMQSVARRYAVPLYWLQVRGEGGAPDTIRNGTTFFVDTGSALFGVTAGHVYDAFVKVAVHGTRCQIGLGRRRSLDLRERLIDRGRKADIATYRFSVEEIAASGADVLRGAQGAWPPAPPQEGRGVIFAGYPGAARRVTAPRELEFSAYSALAIADNVTPRDIISTLDREIAVPTAGLEMPPEGFDVGGLSGAPVLTVIETGGVISWSLGGVIREGTTSLGETVLAARATFISADGQIADDSW
jgi:hypothetical protein